MTGIVGDLYLTGTRVDNYALDATTATAWWTSTTTYTAVVPANRRWFLIGGQVFLDVNATCEVEWYNAGGQLLGTLAYSGAGVVPLSYPSLLSSSRHGDWTKPIIMDPGDYILITFGVAQGAIANCSCVVVEVQV